VHTHPGARGITRPGASLLVVVQSRQPGRQALDGDLEVGVEVDELAQPLGEPGEADLLLAPPLGELLEARGR
jgi:hypothetical protein